MKRKTTNATVSYAPEQVTDIVEISFTRTTSAGGTTVHGRVTKNGSETGSVSHDGKGNYLVVSLKPYSELTAAEAEGVLLAAGRCVREILEDE